MNERKFIYVFLSFLFVIALAFQQLTDYTDYHFNDFQPTQIEENIHEIIEIQEDDTCLLQQTSRSRKIILCTISEKLYTYPLFYCTGKINSPLSDLSHNPILRSVLCIYRI